MATYFPPKRATAYRFWVSLISQANTKIFQSSATLAAGDVKVSKDGGALANLTTLPVVTPSASKLIQVDLSATEMTADNVSILFSDAAGAEWCDLMVNLQTTARQIDDLMAPTVQMTESYAADGTAPTPAQALFAIQQFLQEKNIAGTTMTIKQINGSSTAMTFTLDSATAPTSITRAT